MEKDPGLWYGNPKYEILHDLLTSNGGNDITQHKIDFPKTAPSNQVGGGKDLPLLDVIRYATLFQQRTGWVTPLTEGPRTAKSISEYASARGVQLRNEQMKYDIRQGDVCKLKNVQDSKEQGFIGMKDKIVTVIKKITTDSDSKNGKDKKPVKLASDENQKKDNEWTSHIEWPHQEEHAIYHIDIPDIEQQVTVEGFQLHTRYFFFFHFICLRS